MKVVGYNSHSDKLIPMRAIWESELEKDNIHIVEAIELFGRDGFDDIKATWVCYSAIDCFRSYVLLAEEFYLSDAEVLHKYPNYQDEVYEVDLSGLSCVIGDPYMGYLYAGK